MRRTREHKTSKSLAHSWSFRIIPVVVHEDILAQIHTFITILGFIQRFNNIWISRSHHPIPLIYPYMYILYLHYQHNSIDLYPNKLPPAMRSRKPRCCIVSQRPGHALSKMQIAGPFQNVWITETLVVKVGASEGLLRVHCTHRKCIQFIDDALQRSVNCTFKDLAMRLSYLPLLPPMKALKAYIILRWYV